MIKLVYLVDFYKSGKVYWQKLGSLKARISNHRISAISRSNTKPNFRFTRKMNLQREPCTQISGNWLVRSGHVHFVSKMFEIVWRLLTTDKRCRCCLIKWRKQDVTRFGTVSVLKYILSIRALIDPCFCSHVLLKHISIYHSDRLSISSTQAMK